MIVSSCPPCIVTQPKVIEPVAPLCCTDAPVARRVLGVKVSSIVSNTVSVFEDFVVKMVSTKGVIRPSRF